MHFLQGVAMWCNEGSCASFYGVSGVVSLAENLRKLPVSIVILPVFRFPFFYLFFLWLPG